MLAPNVSGRFSRILLDALCSSEARIILPAEDSGKYWRPRKVSEAACKQCALMESAWMALRPGGRLHYSTCSFAPEENDAVVAHLLKMLSEVRLLPNGI